MTEEQTVEPRKIVLDDGSSHVVEQLPTQIQQMIVSYDQWTVDRANAQKQFTQVDYACRQLAQTISDTIKKYAAETKEAEKNKAKKTKKAKDDAKANAATASAALDVPDDNE